MGILENVLESKFLGHPRLRKYTALVNEDLTPYVALAFARADLLPPLIAAWTANVIFMGIGVSLLLRART